MEIKGILQFNSSAKAEEPALVMTKLGFVKNGLMINLQPLNKKLIKRKAEIEKILINSFEV